MIILDIVYYKNRVDTIILNSSSLYIFNLNLIFFISPLILLFLFVELVRHKYIIKYKAANFRNEKWKL